MPTDEELDQYCGCGHSRAAHVNDGGCMHKTCTCPGFRRSEDMENVRRDYSYPAFIPTPHTPEGYATIGTETPESRLSSQSPNVPNIPKEDERRYFPKLLLLKAMVRGIENAEGLHATIEEVDPIMEEATVTLDGSRFSIELKLLN